MTTKLSWWQTHRSFLVSICFSFVLLFCWFCCCLLVCLSVCLSVSLSLSLSLASFMLQFRFVFFPVFRCCWTGGRRENLCTLTCCCLFLQLFYCCALTVRFPAIQPKSFASCMQSTRIVRNCKCLAVFVLSAEKRIFTKNLHLKYGFPHYPKIRP